MAAPSKVWVNIADSQVDADSPIDGVLLTAYRDDLVHLREWLGLSYTAAQNHNHDGVNSASIILPDNSITGAKLYKTPANGSKAQANPETWTPSAGLYCFTHYTGITTAIFEMYSAGAWQTVGSLATDSFLGQLRYCDGTNMRVSTTTAGTLYYVTF